MWVSLLVCQYNVPFFELFKQLFLKNTSTITGCFNDLLFSYSSSSFFRLLHKAALTQRVWNNAEARMSEKPLCLGRQLHYSLSKLPIITYYFAKHMKMQWYLESNFLPKRSAFVLQHVLRPQGFDFDRQRGRKDSVSRWANAWTKLWVQFQVNSMNTEKKNLFE